MNSLSHNSSPRKIRSHVSVRHIFAVLLSILAVILFTTDPVQVVATTNMGRTDMSPTAKRAQSSTSKSTALLQKVQQDNNSAIDLEQGNDLSKRGDKDGGKVIEGGQDFQDVTTDNTFFAFLHNIYNAQIVSGYPCGGPSEPCGPQNLPYYRPSNFVTRAQMSKFVDLARRTPGINIATTTSLLPLSSSSDAPAGTGVYGTTAGNGLDRTINGVNAGVAGYAFGAGGPDGGSIGVVAYSSLDNGAWIGTGALTDTYGLYVVQGGALIEAGQSTIGNSLYVDGPLTVTGPKTGYVTDIVRNVGNSDLHPGEIVTVGAEIGGPDQLGDIPVPGVLAASHSYDTGVMGVVDMLWVPADPSAPAGTSARTGGYDPNATVIHPGDYMGVVTLGLYKAVKVDATDTPIHMGDILTSGNVPGAAVKAQDKLSAFGATIGKAMGNLETGIGTIPVLVTLK